MEGWCAFVYTIINHIILYTAASIKYFCRGLENTWNCTLAGKNILVFSSKSREKINYSQLFHSRDKHLLCVKAVICRLGFASISWSGGWEVVGWVLQTHSRPNCPFTRLFAEAVFWDPIKLSPNILVPGHSSLSNISDPSCLVFKSMGGYFLWHFIFLEEWSTSLKISAIESVKKFHAALNLFLQ